MKSTSNLYLAAVYLYFGFPLTAINREDPKHVKFTFSGDISELEKIEQQWDNQSLAVSVRRYAESIREMKMKLHQD